MVPTFRKIVVVRILLLFGLLVCVCAEFKQTHHMEDQTVRTRSASTADIRRIDLRPDECTENEYFDYHENKYDQDDSSLPGRQRKPRFADSDHDHADSQNYFYLGFYYPKDLSCFKVFNKKHCDSRDLMLEFCDKETLKLNVPGADHKRLLNFNIYPASFMPFQEKLNNTIPMPKVKCQNDFHLIVSTTFGQEKQVDIKNGCVNVPTFPKKDKQYVEARVITNASNLENICVETFSKVDCTGKRVRVWIPSTSHVWRVIENTATLEAKIWDYFSDAIMDTDVQSIRKCQACQGETTNFYSSESLLKHEDNNSPCTDRSCFLVKEAISGNDNWNKTHCYIYFNGSNCAEHQALAYDENVNMRDLTKIVTMFPEFENWSIAEAHPTCKCVLPNKGLTRGIKDIFPFKKEDKGMFDQVSTWELAVLGVVATLAVLMLIVVIVMSFLLWQKKRRIIIMRQRHADSQAQRTPNVRQIETTEVNDYVNDTTGIGALCTFFANEYEIPRNHINIGNIRDSSASIIGVGEFSIVFKGLLEPSGRPVAVKTMKSGQASPRTIKWTLKECQVFKQLGKHNRILEFLGVCTENVRSGELFVVMAMCDKGSLKGFMVQHKSHFESLIKDGEWFYDNRLEEALDSDSSIEDGPPVKFNTLQLFKWCLEVADAMEFLAVRKIVHASLSARNVLLDEKFSTKLSDFHLTKMPGEAVPPAGAFATANLTGVNKERLVPWRYLAIESLLDDVFTRQSDAWTFGIFMWEVFSLGATPYPEFVYGSEFTLCIKHGYRLQAPSFATTECYQMMLICWYDAPEKRPSFTKLKMKLEAITPKKNGGVRPGSFQSTSSLLTTRC